MAYPIWGESPLHSNLLRFMNPQNPQNSTSSKKAPIGLIAAVVVLALALIGTLIWGANTSSEVDQLQSQKMAVEASLDDMTELRDELATEVETMMTEYDALASENSRLNGELAESQDALSQAQSAVSRAKRNAANEMKALRVQIEELQQAKASLQSNMEMMLAQNDSLKMQIGVLEGDLAMATETNNTLMVENEQKSSQINNLTYESFKATAFQVSPEVKRGNATSKSGRARRITASFDLENVPADFHGTRPIYVVITDQSGVPIPRTDYIQTTIRPWNGEPHDIMAVEAREEELAASQTLTFSHELENKLDAGNYTLSAYTDIGFLGSSTFRLR